MSSYFNEAIVHLPNSSSHAIYPEDSRVPQQLESTKIILPFLLLIVQCSLLHPTFAHSQLAKWIRIGLTPINFLGFLTLPLRYSFMPSEGESPMLKMGLAFIAVGFAIRSLDWGFLRGPVYLRPLKIVNGERRWEKMSKDDQSYQKQQEDEPFNAVRVLLWTLLHFSSYQGLQFSWGPAAAANTHGTASLIRRMILVNVPLTFALAFSVLVRDSPLGTPSSAILSMGIPHLPGLHFWSESLYTLCFGIYIACTIDQRFTFGTLVAIFFHTLLSCLPSSDLVLQCFDPVSYPPAFNSPHRATSIAEFWANGWHAISKRNFVVAGGKPTIWMMKKMGASVRIQKLAGLFGIFAASAFVHEYAPWAISQPPHARSSRFYTAFPGSLFFFMVQPLAILVEPFVIPLIPKRLGGGQLWTWTFLLLTAYPFRVQYISEFGALAKVSPLSQWSWMYILSPLKD